MRDEKKNPEANFWLVKSKKANRRLIKENKEMFLMLCAISRDMQCSTPLDKPEVSLDILEEFIGKKLDELRSYKLDK